MVLIDIKDKLGKKISYVLGGFSLFSIINSTPDEALAGQNISLDGLVGNVYDPTNENIIDMSDLIVALGSSVGLTYEGGLKLNGIDGKIGPSTAVYLSQLLSGLRGASAVNLTSNGFFRVTQTSLDSNTINNIASINDPESKPVYVWANFNLKNLPIGYYTNTSLDISVTNGVAPPTTVSFNGIVDRDNVTYNGDLYSFKLYTTKEFEDMTDNYLAFSDLQELRNVMQNPEFPAKIKNPLSDFIHGIGEDNITKLRFIPTRNKFVFDYTNNQRPQGGPPLNSSLAQDKNIEGMTIPEKYTSAITDAYFNNLFL